MPPTSANQHPSQPGRAEDGFVNVTRASQEASFVNVTRIQSIKSLHCCLLLEMPWTGSMITKPKPWFLDESCKLWPPKGWVPAKLTRRTNQSAFGMGSERKVAATYISEGQPIWPLHCCILLEMPSTRNMIALGPDLASWNEVASLAKKRWAQHYRELPAQLMHVYKFSKAPSLSGCNVPTCLSSPSPWMKSETKCLAMRKFSYWQDKVSRFLQSANWTYTVQLSSPEKASFLPSHHLLAFTISCGYFTMTGKQLTSQNWRHGFFKKN